MAFSRPVNPSSFAHLARSFFTSPQVRISMYSSDSVPITLAVRGPASFGASVSLSHSNSVMAVWMAMARSMYGCSLSNVLLIFLFSSLKSYGKPH